MNTTNRPAPGETWLLLSSLVFDNRGGWRDRITELTGMPFSRFRALRRIENRTLTSSQLAEQLDIDAAATSVIVTDLTTRGLIIKTPDPHDARRKNLTITASGIKLMDQIRELPAPAALTEGLSDDELATFDALLRKVSHAQRS